MQPQREKWEYPCSNGNHSFRSPLQTELIAVDPANPRRRLPFREEPPGKRQRPPSTPCRPLMRSVLFPFVADEGGDRLAVARPPARSSRGIES